jgi:hypothetical protein
VQKSGKQNVKSDSIVRAFLVSIQAMARAMLAAKQNLLKSLRIEYYRADFKASSKTGLFSRHPAALDFGIRKEETR